MSLPPELLFDILIRRQDAKTLLQVALVNNEWHVWAYMALESFYKAKTLKYQDKCLRWIEMDTGDAVHFSDAVTQKIFCRELEMNKCRNKHNQYEKFMQHLHCKIPYFEHKLDYSVSLWHKTWMKEQSRHTIACCKTAIAAYKKKMADQLYFHFYLERSDIVNKTR